MSTQDYIALGMLLIQLVSSIRTHKFTIKSVEKTLARNRNLLGTVLRDIVTKFNSPEPDAKANQAVPANQTVAAHMQGGADV